VAAILVKRFVQSVDRIRARGPAFLRAAVTIRLASLVPLATLGSFVSSGCQPATQDQLVVYTALDREFSEPIFAEFTRQTGIVVHPKYDTEANKTVGLTNLILNERARPRCDLFWNNEILNTLRLEQAGLLAAYDSAVGRQYPAVYRAADGQWYGFAARARVLLVNTERLTKSQYPQRVEELADPQWAGKAALAKPLFGTTASHAACLFQVWGQERAESFFRQTLGQAVVLPGNRQVARAVGAGQVDWGLTDTDDAMLEIEAGMPVELVFPDQQSGGLGTLFIPNTLALIQGASNTANARKLLDYLLSPEVEARLAAGPSAQVPLHPQSSRASRVALPASLRSMEVDFAAAAAQWDEVAEFLRDELP
jgi:iron(III) transport system substrate-binding protein